jgi:transposase InsO family protein
LAAEKEVSVTSASRQLGYSKQAYYKSKTSRQKKTCYYAMAKQKVLAIRRQLPRLGTRKLYYMLCEDFKREHIAVGRDKLFSILRSAKLLIVKKKRYNKTTDSKHWMHKYPNLVKNVEQEKPEQIWVADITWLYTRNGYCYLHLVTDAYSKKIMGYEVSSDLAASSTIKALAMAIKARNYTTPLIHHSDRGLQYCSAGYVKLLNANDIRVSMTQDGSPYDNAIAERINGILKDEFGLDDEFDTIEQANKEVNQSVELYNKLRPHLSNSLLTPYEMHNQNKLKRKAWHKKSTRTLEGSCAFLPSLPIPKPVNLF